MLNDRLWVEAEILEPDKASSMIDPCTLFAGVKDVGANFFDRDIYENCLNN